MLEGARGEQGARRLGQQAAEQATRGPDGDGRADLGARGHLGEVVGDVEADGAAGAQREPAPVGGVDLHVEADAAAGQPTGHVRAAAGREAPARQLLDAEIAQELIVSETTVKTHVARLLMKLRLRDRVQAVVLAYETGLVAPEPSAR